MGDRIDRCLSPALDTWIGGRNNQFAVGEAIELRSIWELYCVQGIHGLGEPFTRELQYAVSATDKMNGYKPTKQVFLNTLTTFGLPVREVNRIVSLRWHRLLSLSVMYIDTYQ